MKEKHLSISGYELPHVIHEQEPAKSITRDCDCACSTNLPNQISNTCFDSSNSWQLSSLMQSYSLSSKHRLVYIPGETSAISIVNNSAWEMLLNFQEGKSQEMLPKWEEQWGKSTTEETLNKFVSLAYITNSKENENLAGKDFHVLSAWLHMTDRCNLRCKYCYLPHSNVDLSLETGLAAIDATFRSALTHGFKQVKLKYSGGEPLLRFPLITKLHKYAQELATRKQISLDGIILSNGTLLTTSILQKMRHLNIRLMISIDGLGAYHDAHRVYTNGAGSFQKVSRAIRKALDFNIIPDISITVNSHNLNGLPELVSWVIEKDLPFNLNFYRPHHRALINSGLQLEEERIISGMKKVYRVIEANIPRRSLLASLVDRANLSVSHLYTCGVGQNYLVFNHLGQVAKCQMAMDEIVTSVHADDPLFHIQHDREGIINLPVDQKHVCQDCEWKYWCGGGCPFTARKITGRYDVQSPNCNIYKALYPEAVRLEGIRLMKWYP